MSEKGSLERVLHDYDQARADRRPLLSVVRVAGAGRVDEAFDALRLGFLARGARAFLLRRLDAPGPLGLFHPLVPELVAHLVESGAPSKVFGPISRRLSPMARHAVGSKALREAIFQLLVEVSTAHPAFVLSVDAAADADSLDLLEQLVAPGSSFLGHVVLVLDEQAAKPAGLDEALARMSAKAPAPTGRERGHGKEVDLYDWQSHWGERQQVVQPTRDSGLQKVTERLEARLAFAEAARLMEKQIAAAGERSRPQAHLRLARVLRAGGDFRAALKHLGLARRGCAGAAARELRAETAGVLLQLDRCDIARKLCLQVLDGEELPAAGDAVGQEAWAILAQAELQEGSFQRSADLARQAVAVLGEKPCVLPVRLTLGNALFHLADYDGAQAAFVANASLAQSLSMPQDEAKALVGQGWLAQRRGDRRSAIALFRSALSLVGSQGQVASSAYASLGSTFADVGELEPAIACFEKAAAAGAGEASNPVGQSQALSQLSLAWLYSRVGDLPQVRQICEEAASAGERAKNPNVLASVALLRGQVMAETGELDDALRELGFAHRTFTELGARFRAAEASIHLARAHVARKEPALARKLLEEAGKQDASDPAWSELLPQRHLVLARLELQERSHEEAARHLGLAREQVASQELAVWLRNELRIELQGLLAEVRRASGDEEGAAADLARAARLLQDAASTLPARFRKGFLDRSCWKGLAAPLPEPAASELAASTAQVPSAPIALVAVAAGASPASAPVAAGGPGHPIVGGSEKLREVLAYAARAARSQATVLIRGESGTGKELLAEMIHAGSSRRGKPLVKVNCAAMAEDLLLSELFGHEKGAFTGAVRDRKGRFELADGGTLFLDEIGDVSGRAQVALLRVLQEREFERVGGTRTLRVDVRVVCATNRHLEQMVAAGAFRHDLYYRLREVQLELPPLRERLDDIPQLADDVLARCAQEGQEAKKKLSPEAMAVLRRYPWPGNIRELQNVLRAAAILSPNAVLSAADLCRVKELAPLARAGAAVAAGGAASASAAMPAPALDGMFAAGPGSYYKLLRESEMSLGDLKSAVEHECIKAALAEAGGSISGAARLLRMKRSRLSQIVNEHPELRPLSGSGGAAEPVEDEGD